MMANDTSASPNSGGGSGVNVMSLITQLRDTQERLRLAEARAKTLEDENRRLRAAEFGGAGFGTRRTGSSNGSGILDMNRNSSATPSGVLRLDELEANDRAMVELKQHAIEMTRRNAMLEREKTDTNAAMRRQYEQRIETLEIELRRARAAAGGIYKTQAAQQQATLQQQQQQQQEQQHQHMQTFSSPPVVNPSLAFASGVGAQQHPQQQGNRESVASSAAEEWRSPSGFFSSPPQQLQFYTPMSSRSGSNAESRRNLL